MDGSFEGYTPKPLQIITLLNYQLFSIWFLKTETPCGFLRTHRGRKKECLCESGDSGAIFKWAITINREGCMNSHLGN